MVAGYTGNSEHGAWFSRGNVAYEGARIDWMLMQYMPDSWNVHFTLMMPYEGNQRDAMTTALCDLFDDEPIQVESICLLYKDDDETHYRLYREYHLADYR